jgi:hypothetical protein
VTRTRLFAIPLLVLALAAAACGGDDDEQAAPTTTGSTQPAPPTGTTTEAPKPGPSGTEAPVMGKVLLSFVKAAGRGDADAMWSMLSEATQASVGPTLDDFRGGTAGDLENGLGTLAGTAKVVLSRRMPDDWGVAAITGERDIDNRMEHFAYGAALIEEGGKWKLELGGVVITGLKPEPLAETDARPDIGANVGAGGDILQTGMWLDGEPLPFTRQGNAPFAAQLVGNLDHDLKPGRHVVAAFGSTDISASATAWTFSVQG